MSTNLTEVAQYDADVPVADDGDAVNSAEKVTLAQPLANRAALFKSLLDGTLTLAQFKQVSDEAAGVLQTLTSAVLTNVTAVVVSVDVVQNDIVLAWWDQSWASVGTAEAGFQSALNYAGLLMDGGLGIDAMNPTAVNNAKTLQMAHKVAPITGTFTVQAQGAKNGAAADVELRNQYLLCAVVLRPVAIVEV